ncbi:MAG: Sapep family Mn(2+)-dependent dipeptidase [Clostridia bacterium]
MEKARQLLKKYTPEMIKTIQETVRFNTIKKEAVGIYPYGKDTAECLDYVLNKCQELGLSIYNCDYHAGHADFGEGDTILGILGHLDVVPVSENGWKYPPFSGTVAEGKIWGRGALDDKAPMISCLYAIKALKESGFKPSKKIRLIFGCDEEDGMTCISYYKTKVKMPDLAFTPDGDFPCLNGEKGLFGVTIDFGKLPTEVLELTAGDRINVVPDCCTALISSVVDTKDILNCGLEISKTDRGTLIKGTGLSVHGSLPETGINATWKVCKALHTLFPYNETLKFVNDKMTYDTDGHAWGFPFKDEQSGKITISMDVLRIVNGNLYAGIDIRFPVTFTCDQIEQAIYKNSLHNIKIIDAHKANPLYVEKDSFLVKTLLNAFNEVTGKNEDAHVIGGGTYAKSMPNCIAAGPEFEGDENLIHQTNEYISLDRLEQMTNIYLKAIYDLSK